MNVKDLQHFLHSLSQPLIAAGAKKAADDLDRACAAMEPFGELSIPQFADFLANAEVYARHRRGPRHRGAEAGRPAVLDQARRTGSRRRSRGSDQVAL